MSIVIDNRKLKSAALARHRSYKTGKPVFDTKEIKILLLCRFSLSRVAKRVGCSTWVVQKVKKQLKSEGYKI